MLLPLDSSIAKVFISEVSVVKNGGQGLRERQRKKKERDFAKFSSAIYKDTLRTSSDDVFLEGWA